MQDLPTQRHLDTEQRRTPAVPARPAGDRRVGRVTHRYAGPDAGHAETESRSYQLTP